METDKGGGDMRRLHRKTRSAGLDHVESLRSHREGTGSAEPHNCSQTENCSVS